jgi:CheY-like chemotaxis protein
MSSGRKTVLVAEDTADLLQLFTLVVGLGGYNTVEATDGAQAVEQATLCQPDLILMDIAMPVMDGYEATRRILSNPVLSKVPIIAISAQTSRRWQELALEAGCVECVPKPVEPSDLHELIGRYIGCNA